MSLQRVALLVFALFACLDGEVFGQPPEVVPLAETVTPPEPAADSRQGWFGVVDAVAVRPQNYFAWWGEGSKGLTVYKDVPPRWSWTVSPQTTLGYQFADGSALLASYRYLGSSGEYRDDYSTLRADLDSHWLDLDYRGPTYRPWETIALQLQGGARLGVLDQEFRYQSAYDSDSTRQTFFGAGPHLGSSLIWNPGQGNLGFFARVDLGVLVGETRYQTRIDSSDTNFPEAGSRGTRDTVRRTQILVNPRGELGMNWCPLERPWLSLEAGVRLDDFALFDKDVKGSPIVQNVGPFLRCKIGF